MHEIPHKFQEYIHIVYGIIDSLLWLANPFPDLNPFLKSDFHIEAAREGARQFEDDIFRERMDADID